MLSKRFFFGLGLAMVILATACGGRQSQQPDESGVSMTLEAQTTSVGESELIVTMTSADGSPLDDATLAVRGDMTHAGMTPVVREVSGGTNGVYTIPFEWTMAGDWFVTVDATLPDGEVISRRFDGLTIGGMGEMDMGGDQ